MTGNEQIVINLLADRRCSNCSAQQDHDSCCVWLDEAIGWSWMTKNKEGTCALWSSF